MKIMKDNCFSSVSQSDLNVLDWSKLSEELDLAERPLKDMIESLNLAQKDVLDRLAADIEASFDDHEQHIVALERKVESAEALLKKREDRGEAAEYQGGEGAVFRNPNDGKQTY